MSIERQKLKQTLTMSLKTSFTKKVLISEITAGLLVIVKKNQKKRRQNEK